MSDFTPGQRVLVTFVAAFALLSVPVAAGDNSATEGVGDKGISLHGTFACGPSTEPGWTFCSPKDGRAYETTWRLRDWRKHMLERLKHE